MGRVPLFKRGLESVALTERLECVIFLDRRAFDGLRESALKYLERLL